MDTIYIKNENIIHDKDNRKYILNLYQHHRVEKLSSLLDKDFVDELKKNNHHHYISNVLVVFDDGLPKGNYGHALAEEKLIFVNHDLQCFDQSLDFVLKHEYLHLVDFFENNQMGHRKSWKDLMRLYGLYHMARFDCEAMFPEDYVNV